MLQANSTVSISTTSPRSRKAFQFPAPAASVSFEPSTWADASSAFYIKQYKFGSRESRESPSHLWHWSRDRDRGFVFRAVLRSSRTSAVKGWREFHTSSGRSPDQVDFFSWCARFNSSQLGRNYLGSSSSSLVLCA